MKSSMNPRAKSGAKARAPNPVGPPELVTRSVNPREPTPEISKSSHARDEGISPYADPAPRLLRQPLVPGAAPCVATELTACRTWLAPPGEAPEGRQLYRSLGWETFAEILVASTKS